jgi:putative oxidoreductase
MSCQSAKVGLSRKLGRVLVAAPLVYGGYGAAKDPGHRHEVIAKVGFPESPEIVRANGIAMVVGGVALALGIAPRVASLGLIASLGATTYAGHPFWLEDDPDKRKAQLMQFGKNLGMIGALLTEFS